MSYIYLDMLKLAVPQGARTYGCARESDLRTGAQYVALGSYDLVHYELPADSSSSCQGLEWLEQCHELRHDLDWNYERHPMFLYAPGSLYKGAADLLDVNTYPARPLVLTMVRMAKRPFTLSSVTSTIDHMLESLQRQLDTCCDSQELPTAVSWNLGNCDFMILSKPERLELVRDLMLEIARRGLRLSLDDGEGLAIGFASFSSYCAFRADENRENRLDRDGLWEWLGRERDLEVHTLLDTVPALCTTDKRLASGGFVFGDRDYLFAGDKGFGGMCSFDRVAAVEREMLDEESLDVVRGSSLILSLPMPASCGNGESQGVASDHAADFAAIATMRNAFISPLLRYGQELERSSGFLGESAPVCLSMGPRFGNGG